MTDGERIAVSLRAACAGRVVRARNHRTPHRLRLQHLARVIEAIPDAVLNKGRGPITGHRFSYVDLPPTDLATLRYLVEDYVGHIRHHVKQIERLLQYMGRARSACLHVRPEEHAASQTDLDSTATAL